MSLISGKPSFEEDVNDVMELVTEATIRRVPRPDTTSSQRRVERFLDKITWNENLWFKTIFFLFIPFAFFGALAIFLNSKIFEFLALGIYSLILLTWIFFLLAVISSGIPKIHRILKSPYRPFLDSVNTALTSNMHLLWRFHNCSIEARKAVLAHYHNERTSMERRGAALSGSIDRMGLFPALAAVAVLIFGGAALDEELRAAFYVIVMVIPFFHVMNFSAVGMYEKMDKIITILKISIDLSEREVHFSSDTTEQNTTLNE